ncbi:MAG: hypothetical protein PHN37_02765 [Candidatus Pacebacteria bacterium]|nr:hypothetical protein [Candidatus Paceibacterota bacterium]
MFNYSLEEMWELYRALPQDLKEASFSEKNTERISSICRRYEVDPEKESQIIKMTAHVLFGLLPPPQLALSIEKELKIKKEIAEKIATEINAFVFLKVKNSLEALYNIKIEGKEEKIINQKDTYREPIE